MQNMKIILFFKENRENMQRTSKNRFVLPPRLQRARARERGLLKKLYFPENRCIFRGNCWVVVRVSVVGGTIPHGILGAFGASRIKMRPAQKGRGVIACAAVRAVVESAGIKDVVTKSLGSNNPLNLVKATLQGLLSGRTREQVEALRGVKLS
jgi:hypothetical protein